MRKPLGTTTSNSTVYNLLARHGWRKLMPRPSHPERDIAAQNSFKKIGFPRACPQLGDSQEYSGVIHGMSADSELTDAPLRPS
jgi:hypothetical protein